jgi:hypothetical protein
VVLAHIVHVGVAKVDVVETFVFLTGPEKHVQPGTELLGHVLRLKEFSLDAHEVVLVGGPTRKDDLVDWLVGSTLTKVSQVMVTEYLGQVKELGSQLTVVLRVIQ